MTTRRSCFGRAADGTGRPLHLIENRLLTEWPASWQKVEQYSKMRHQTPLKVLGPDSSGLRYYWWPWATVVPSMELHYNSTIVCAARPLRALRVIGQGDPLRTSKNFYKVLNSAKKLIKSERNIDNGVSKRIQNDTKSVVIENQIPPWTPSSTKAVLSRVTETNGYHLGFFSTFSQYSCRSVFHFPFYRTSFDL